VSPSSYVRSVTGHPDAALIKPIQLRSAAQLLDEPAETRQVLDGPAPIR
jgi:hypothetical protein